MNIQSIVTKLKSDKQFNTEEATKNGLILPLFNSLGYDVFDTDEFKPEVSADVGSKQGEKVDYAVYIKGQPVMIIECKQRDKRLDNHINQLYRYFTTIPDMHLAILTNGDDYWFFTDNERPNIMDLEPYMKIKLSTADETELQQLEKYSKENITKLDLKKDMKWQSFNDECDKLVDGLYTGNVPNYIIKAIASEAGTSIREMNQYNMAEIVYNKLIAKFNGYKIESEPLKINDTDILFYLNRATFGGKVDARAFLHEDNTMTLLRGSVISLKVSDDKNVLTLRNCVSANIRDGVVIEDILCNSVDDAASIVLGGLSNGQLEWKDTEGKQLHKYLKSKTNKDDKSRGELQKETMQKNRENKSNIKLNHEYVYNDYSDGNWVYHTIEYYTIFDEKIENSSAKQMLIDTVETLLDLGLIERHNILKQEQFSKTYAILDTPGNKRGMHYIEKYNIYISTSYGISDIIKFIEKVFDYANIQDNSLKISFKE